MSGDVVSVDGAGKKRAGWRRPAVLTAGGVLVVAVLGGVVWATARPSEPDTFVMRGELSLVDGSVPVDFEVVDCTGGRGYGDVRAGAAVTVSDAAGKVLASGHLGRGRYSGQDRTTPCRFPLEVAEVPRGERLYLVEVAGRGKVTVTAKEAEGGRFAMSLGG